MKKLYTIIAIAFMAISIYAQDSTQVSNHWTQASIQVLAGPVFNQRNGHTAGNGEMSDCRIAAKPTIEVTSGGDNYLLYGYLQIGIPVYATAFDYGDATAGSWFNRDGYSGYMQLFWEQQMYKTLSFHTEYKAYLYKASEPEYEMHHNFMAGPAYTFNSKYGYTELELLYRGTLHDVNSTPRWSNGIQFSVVSGYDWGVVNLANFEDLWFLQKPGTKTLGSFDLYSETRVFFPIHPVLEVGAYICWTLDTDYSSVVFTPEFLAALKIKI